MVMRSWTRYTWPSVAAVSALIHVFQSGCFYPDYTFNEPEPTGAGGASGSVSGSGMSSAGGASTQVSSGAGGSPTSTTDSATSTSSSSSSSASSSSTGTGGGVVIAPANLIDDMEAGSSNILQRGGRVGAWYTYNDGTVGATQTPMAGGPFLPQAIPGGRDGSTEAAHTAGMGFTTWGGGMGFDLHNDGIVKQAYSVAGLTGIAFWAKGSPTTIRFKVLLLGTVPVAETGECTKVCGDSHGAILSLTAEWQQFVIPFSSLKQQNWGTPAPWDPATVLSMQFQAGIGSLDFWVDDIGLY